MAVLRDIFCDIGDWYYLLHNRAQSFSVIPTNQSKWSMSMSACFHCIGMTLTIAFLSGCVLPDANFTHEGTILEDGRLRVDGIITLTCYGEKIFSSRCVERGDNSSNGLWSPAPQCPTLPCKWYQMWLLHSCPPQFAWEISGRVMRLVDNKTYF